MPTTEPTPPGRRPLRPVQVLLVVLALVAAVVVFDRLDGGSTTGSTRQSGADPTPTAPAYPTTIDRLSPDLTGGNQALSRCVVNAPGLSRCGRAPQLRGITRWFNYPAASTRALLDEARGKVVLLDFFSYSCDACRRDQSHLARWASTYRSSGLVVIGVQTPQWDFERDPGHVAAAVRRLGITYPVALDADAATYDAYRSTARPARYLIGGDGAVRAIGFGTGGAVRTESQIRRLLLEASPGTELPRQTSILPPDESDGQAAEIRFGTTEDPAYTGGPRLMRGRTARYAFADDLDPSQFTLSGEWTAGPESIEAGRHARVRISFATMRAAMVAAGSGTLTVHERGRPTRSVSIAGNPGPRLLFTGRLDLGVPVTFDVSPGLRLYALSVR